MNHRPPPPPPHGRGIVKRSLRWVSTTAIIMMMMMMSLCLLWGGGSTTMVNAKEIEVTNEWTLLGENDTIPAGMHIRIDMTTGEKWVKLMDNEEEDERITETATFTTTSSVAIIQADGSFVSTGTTTTTTTTTTSTENSSDSDNSTKKTTTHPNQQKQHKYDYEMMHRTLSKLPLEEQERMGGLPQLPLQHQEQDEHQHQQQEQQQQQQGSSTLKLTSRFTPDERQRFETRMTQLWLQRQEELRQFEIESVMNMPELLKDRIQRLRVYYQDPITQLQEIQSTNLQHTKDYQSSSSSSVSSEQQQQQQQELDEEQAKLGNPVTHIISVLQDLEYQLSDIDMARDFHTLGGWQLLVALISDQVHNPVLPLSPVANHSSSTTTSTATDTTTTTTRNPMFPMRLTAQKHAVQAHAAWTVGSVIKNTEEFFPYAIEPISLSVLIPGSSTATTTITSTTTAIDLLIDLFLQPHRDENSWEIRLLQSKAIYGIGSLLRGNRLAQLHLCRSSSTSSTSSTIAATTNGPARLGAKLQELSNPKSKRTSARIKLIHRLLSLASDIVSHVEQHDEEERATTKSITKEQEQQQQEHSKAIVESFTSSEWCSATLTLVASNQFTPIPLAEAVMTTVIVLGPYCQARFWKETEQEPKTTTTTTTFQQAIDALQAWQNEWRATPDDFDKDHFQQLMDLIEKATHTLLGTTNKTEETIVKED
jgi:nucleotide exchange factor SIL1